MAYHWRNNILLTPCPTLPSPPSQECKEVVLFIKPIYIYIVLQRHTCIIYSIASEVLGWLVCCVIYYIAMLFHCLRKLLIKVFVNVCIFIGNAYKSCYMCKHMKERDPGVHMHRFPANPERRQQWCQALHVQEKDLPKHARLCSRHFLDGDTSNLPSLSVGKGFASPKKFPFTCQYHLESGRNR